MGFGRACRTLVGVASLLGLLMPSSAAGAKLGAADIAAGTVVSGDYDVGGLAPTGGGFFSCPTGTKVVSGGADAFSIDASDAFYAVTSSSPTFDGRGWYTHAVGITDTNVAVDAAITCVPQAKLEGTKLRQTTKRFLDTRTVSAKCPRGMRAYTGGAFVNATGADAGPTPDLADDAYLSASYPTAGSRGWSATVVTRGSTALELTVDVRCLPERRMKAVKPRSLEKRDTGLTQLAFENPCPANTRVMTTGALWHRPGRPPSPASAERSLLQGTRPIAEWRRATAVGNLLSAGGQRLELSSRSFCLA